MRTKDALEQLKEKKDRESGRQVVSALGGNFNSFGSSKKLAEEIMGELDDESLKTLKIILIAGLKVLIAYGDNIYKLYSDQGDRAERMLDGRKRNAILFAMYNRSEIESEFQRLTGFPFPICESLANEPSLGRQLDYLVIKEKGLQWLVSAIEAWQSEHPTLVQSIYRGFADTYLLTEAGLKDDGTASFPFI